ncbi:YoaP domain-containing protein [Arcticibacter tournemirensis]
MEEIIKLTAENIDTEHICCAIADQKCQGGYQAKKKWIKDQLTEGFTFKKLDVRGKVFIEYIPAENAWCPVDAPGYMLINCFWVSGQFKGKGYGKRLYEECLKDSDGKNGIIVVVSAKKQSFMSDKKFFIKQGFVVCDTAEPYFELLYKPLRDDAPLPKFKDCAKKAECDNKEGLTVYYTNGCPFTEYYVAELETVAEQKGYKLKTVKIASKEQAQNHFVPVTNYSIFKDGSFVTQHILNETYFDKFIKN